MPGSTGPIITKFKPYGRYVDYWSDCLFRSSKDVAMATNFLIKIGETDPLTFIRRLGIQSGLDYCNSEFIVNLTLTRQMSPEVAESLIVTCILTLAWAAVNFDLWIWPSKPTNLIILVTKV